MTYTFLHSTDPSIKICGITDEAHVDVAVGAGADAIGFVFVPSSPRYIDRSLADQFLHQLPSDVLPVAVLQDYADIQDFSDWPGWLQLCGNENEEIVASSPRPVIKAFNWNKEELVAWDRCQSIEAILVDGSSGGLGKMIPINELASLLPSMTKPLIVAGGLTPQNVVDVISVVRPAAVDVSSGVESSTGKKDGTLICDFVRSVIQTRE